MDMSFESSIASVISVLEDGVTPAEARAALQSCHGNVERAIMRILDNRDQAKRAASAMAMTPGSRGVINLDAESSDSEDDAPPGVPARSRLITPSSKRRKLDEVVSPSGAKCSAREKPYHSTDRVSTPSSSSGAKPKEELQLSRIKAFMMGQSSLPSQEHHSAAAKKFKIPDNVGSLHSTLLDASPEWALFEHPQIVCPAIEGDPPCLTLRGLNTDASLLSSSGMLHAETARDGWCQQFSDFVMSGVERSKSLVRVKDTILVKLFQDLFEKVRYQPVSFECCWRVIDMPSNANNMRSHWSLLTPSDLRGPLPKRPFALLDNANDPQANQPPHFVHHCLRPEQLRSLSWMLAREGHNANTGMGDDPGNEFEPFLVEWRRFWTPGRDFTESEDIPDQIVNDALVRLRPDIAGPLGGLEGKVLSHRSGRATVEFPSRKPCELSTEDLELVPQDGLCIGALVHVRRDVECPKFGWGGVKHGMVGVVKALLPQNGKVRGSYAVHVHFRSHENWKGMSDELALYHGSTHSGGSEKTVTLDIRIRASYPVRGGILADKIGYGKTATTIALIDSAQDRPHPPIPEPDRDSFIPAKGTLIIVPSNLLDQWLNEISKFVWDGRPMKKAMKSGWSPKGCPLRIFAMTNVTPLTSCKAKDLAEADVVICSYRLLFSPIYQDRREELSRNRNQPTVGHQTLRGLVTCTKELLEGKTEMRSGRKGEDHVRSWENLMFPVLEMFYWRRVVFDEFHELESFESRQQNSLQHMRSHYRWGLTGTPPVSCNAGAIFMSSLFRVDLPGYLSSKYGGHAEGVLPGSYPDLGPWEGDKLLSEVAGRFLDHFVRQNTAELPHIGLEEHVVFVRHSATERALYLGQAHDAPDLSSEDAFATEESRQALERLLKLCSHFQAVGDTTSNAKEECLRIGEQKERRLVKARNQLHRCARVIFLLRSKLDRTKQIETKVKKALSKLVAAEEKLVQEGNNGAAAAKALGAINTEVNTEDSATRIAVLNEHKPKNQDLAVRLFAMRAGQADHSQKGYADLWSDLARTEMSNEEAISFLTGQASEQASNLEEFAEARASAEFFQRTVDALIADDTPSNRACVVCLEEGFPLDQLSITPCAHAFCIQCLQATIEKFRCCSICRRELTTKDIRPLSREAKERSNEALDSSFCTGASSSSAGPQLGKESIDAHENGVAAAAKHGTKLAAVVRKLQELRREDSTAKVILFVQFDDLKKKVAGALADFGVPAVQLHGSTGQRSNIINDWQNNPNSQAFVLLLSLTQSASGTNLTAANHVVFLHPMLAPSAEMAIGYELQAIGRARRHGQPRNVVHVWRFVATDTVEQSITEKHQAGLWERETAREAREAAHSSASSGAGSASELVSDRAIVSGVA